VIPPLYGAMTEPTDGCSCEPQEIEVDEAESKSYRVTIHVEFNYEVETPSADDALDTATLHFASQIAGDTFPTNFQVTRKTLIVE